MTDLPPGDSFHNYDAPPAKAYHAYMQTRDLNDGVRYATRLALDRARRDGHNPRKGTVTVYFDDDGVGAKWEPKS
ncbi:MAG TPA: hypothetical protein VJ617_12175 [Arthrobacter sp.]|nr:hypothetical protein [Arthrobacter sp.]